MERARLPEAGMGRGAAWCWGVRLGCGLSLLALLGCQSFSRSRLAESTVAVAVENIAPVERVGPSPRARVDLLVRNPNGFALELNGLRFALDLNGHRFADGQTSEMVIIPRGEDATVSVVVATEVLDVLRQLSGSGTDFSYVVSGELFVQHPEEGVLPFHHASGGPGEEALPGN